MFDGHVHIRPGNPEPRKLLKRMAKTGVTGAILISMPPENGSFSKRMGNLREWTSGYDELVPFFWIDAVAEDAVGQVEAAKDSGAAGLKIICDSFYPGDERCMNVCKAAAHLDMPVLFHSGILWDGKPSSGYCRPVNFESLLEVENLRFSLAHIGWPWIDEMIAVYGKFQNFRTMNPGLGTEMFIDTTPGTPKIYREDALRKLLTVGYDIENNIFFGSDCDANGYNAEWTGDWIDTDTRIIGQVTGGDSLVRDIFSANVKRFVSGTPGGREFARLEPAVP